MRGRRKGIFGLLVSSYILFAISLIMALIIALVVTVTYLAGAFVMPDPQALMEDPTSKGAKAFIKAGGWMEVLDKDFRVVSVIGEKADATMEYSVSDILLMLDPANAWKELPSDGIYAFRGFMREESIEGEAQYLLVKISRDAVEVQNSIKITNNNSNQKYFTIFTCLLVLLFALNSVVVSLYLKRKIKKPLDAISAGMGDLHNGKKNVRLDFRAEMEFEEIRDAFNYMSECLEREKQQRTENENQKNQLLLDLSHDIRTPISTIKAYANALEAGLVSPEEYPRYFQTIESKADRVNHLTADLFTMLKMDSVDYLLKKEEVNISELARAVCAEYYEEITQSGLELEVDIPTEAIEILADKGLMKRVLENLVGNAIKYNKTGHFIKVCVYPSKDRRVVVEVLDDGNTISPEEQKQLFNAFTRCDKARASDGGSGLGLAIVKTIVEKHGGFVCYQIKNSWNCFQITIP